MVFVKILMIGVSDLRWYSRGHILSDGLTENKVNVETVFLTKKMKYGRIAFRLLKRDFDVVISTGKIVLLISWLLKIWHHKPIIFDTFISDYDTLVLDRKIVHTKSFWGRLAWWSDKIAPRLATISFLDTKSHISFFKKEFGLDESLFRVVYVGSDEKVFTSSKCVDSGKIIVHFHGTFIPLQGVDVIVRAAKLIENHTNIHINCIGRGQTYDVCKKISDDLGLKNISFESMVDLETLHKRIADSTLCLGIFGSTDKAQRVVPNKVYEALAVRRPLITMDCLAIREVLTHRVNAWLIPTNNPEALADAILKLSKNKKIRDKIAKNGYELFKEKYSTKAIGKELLEVIEEVIYRKGV